MSEPTAVVRLAFDAVNGGDVEGLLALCDPEIELTDVPAIPGSTTYRGRDGIRRWFGTVREVMDELRFEFGEATEAGNAVVVETTARGVGRDSGAPVEWTFWTLWRVRDGLIDYHHGYTDRDDAVAALESAA